MSKIGIVMFSLLVLPLSAMADCPLGAKEDHLTIHRVMRNFGRFTSDADALCVKGTNPWEQDSVNEADFNTAIDKLGLAIDCAAAVLKDPTGDLLPSRLTFISNDQEKAELMDDFVYFMTDFKDGLTEYREMFKKLLSQKPADRSFGDVNSKRQELDNLVQRAHKKL